MGRISETKFSIPDESTVDLAELFGTIWRGKALLAASIIITLGLAISYLHFATYMYTAELAVKPAQLSASNRSRQIGGLGDLASLAGVSIPTDQGGAQFQLYVESLRSRVAADALSKDVDLMRAIFRNEWNETTQSWEEPKSQFRTLLQAVKPVLGIPNYPWQPPDGSRLKIYMDSHLKIEQSSKEIIVTVAFTDRDPQVAIKFLSALHEVVDTKLRQDTLFRSTTNVAYLAETLKTVTVAEHRQAITQALIDEEKNLMMANSNQPFAAEPFGGPTALFRPTDPNPLLILSAGALAGILIGVGAALLTARRRTGNDLARRYDLPAGV